MNRIIKYLCALVIGVGLVQTASAQQHAAQVDLIVQSLDAGPATRSLNNPALSMLSADQIIPHGFDLPSHTIYVGFESGGHMISYAGMSQLRSIAAALMDPKMTTARFQVAAHMPQTSNGLPVSSRRAQVIVEHLETFYGVPKGILIPVGYGNLKLSNAAAPLDSSNERIEFINVTSLK